MQITTSKTEASEPQIADHNMPSEIEKGQDDSSSSTIDDLDKAPDGGLEAWLAAAGAGSIFFCCLGFANSFGVFQEYYATHQLQHWSPDDIAWIGSIAAFIQFMAGAIGGPLFDRYGSWVVRPAAIFYLFAIMMISLCKEYWQFMLAQGILTGTLMAFLQLPAIAAVGQFFDKKRAAALGLAISGSSIGGIVMPITLSKLLNGTDIGFGWSVRIVGFMMIPFMLFSVVTVKARLPPRKTNFFIAAAFKNTQYLLLVAALFFEIIPMFTLLFFLPSYAVTRGMSATLASYLLAIVNAASTFGRIIPGVLADKYGRLNIFAFAGFGTGICALCLNEATTNAGLIVYAVFFGFTSGTIVSGGSAAISNCPPNMRDMGTYMGMGMALASFASLVGPPVSGAMYEKYGGFEQVAIFSGVMSLVGGVIVVVTKAITTKGLLSWT